MNTDTMVTVGDGDQISLADLAGIDMADVVENRGPEPLPAGVYEFTVKEAELKTRESKGVNKPVVELKLEVASCLVLVNSELAPEDYEGQLHFETIWITDVAKDLGRVKALMVDAGLEGSGPVNDLLMSFIGHNFIAPIKHRKNPNDADIIYANIDSKKVRPAIEGAEETA